MERTAFAQRVGFFAASSLVLFGCVNPNTYTTPRTIGSGRFQGSVAGEAWGSYTPASSNDQTAETRSGPSLTPPTVTVRLGLGDSCEIGARVSNMSSLGGDIKWNPFRSRAIDLAIDPAFQISEVSAEDGTTETLSFLHVPLLVGVNLSRKVSLILTPGISWGFVSGGKVLLRSGDAKSAPAPAPSGDSGSEPTLGLCRASRSIPRSRSCVASARSARSSMWPGSV